MQLSPQSFPQESVIRINLPILAFSVALALVSGLLFGLVPALRLSRPDLARTSAHAHPGVSRLAPAKHRWSALIAAQVALTLLLMATAGTAIRSFLHLTQLPLGYDPDHVMQVGIVMHFRERASNGRGIQSREAAQRIHRADPAEDRRRSRRLAAPSALTPAALQLATEMPSTSRGGT